MVGEVGLGGCAEVVMVVELGKGHEEVWSCGRGGTGLCDLSWLGLKARA